MQKKYNRFKKLKVKIKKRERKKKETPQNCKSPMQRQRFIAAIKNVTEKNKKLKNLIRFHNANKIDNYNGGGERKKIQKNLQSKSKQE